MIMSRKVTIDNSAAMIKDFIPYPEIETIRLRLRKISVADLEDMFFMRSDSEVNLYLGDYRHASKQVTSEWLDKIIAGIENEDWLFWVMESKVERRFVGSVCLWNLSTKTNSAELGYAVHPDFQKQGLMDEALKAVVNFGFERMKLSFIDAFTHRENQPSIRLLERNAFVFDPNRKAEEGSSNICYVKKSK